MNNRNTVKTSFLIILGLLCHAPLAFAGKAADEPTQKSMQAALHSYLAQQGNFCLGKFNWPIDVSEADFAQQTKDALQMPALEKLGLVAAVDIEATRKLGDTQLALPYKRYTLTAAGKKFYLPKKIITEEAGQKIEHTHDLCAAKLTLDKVVRWEKIQLQGDNQVTTVSYTFKVAAPDWTHDADLQKVFPMLATVLNGEGSLQLKQLFRWSGKRWVPVYPWEV